MASKLQDIKGPIAITGRFEAQPGKADELAQWAANLKARADSDQEPGTVQYNIVRFGESFFVFEEYTGLEALVAHSSSPLFQEFSKNQDTLVKVNM
ncbi:hypothetical protein ACEPAH_24 [Sanghuangporus vaninii]